MPDHWHRFGTRGSNYSAPGARGAANPINAMLNYLYALLEAEAVFAIQAVGLDPGIGILHSDQRARDSFALDLMEPVRPLVDQWLLDFLRDRKLRASDFADTRRGVCRIHPVLTHWLATTTIEWATALEPHARHVAQILTDTPNIRIDRVPSPLIGAKKPRTTPPKRENSPRESSDLERVCQVCGASTSNGRKLCDECLPDVHAAHVQEMVAGAHERLRELRIRGEDPSRGGEAAAKRGSANQEHQKHIKEWDRNDAQNPVTDFQEQILPLLQDVPLAVMAKATGLSGGYCSYIKRGIKIPHERHWQSLQDVGDS